MTDPDALPRIAVADCETDPFKKGRDTLTPFIWGFFDGDDYREFTTIETFVAFVREFDGILYAHNGGKFDWHFILPHMDGLQDLMIINGRLSRFKIGACEFRDSYNILPVPLSAYQKTEIDYSIFEEGERNKPENWKLIREYLQDDCRFLFEIVTEFIRRYGLHLTQAGAALRTWEAMTGLQAPKSTPEFYDEYHRWYYGGRVQCFREGVADVPFVVADINSAYPRAMLETHPFAPVAGSLRNLTVAQARAWVEKRGPGLVFLTVQAKSRGAFPWRSEDDNALYFPDDNALREFHVTGWEFLAALDTKTADVLKVDEIRVFTGGINFRDYIDHFYTMRKKAKATGDKAGDIFAKLLMNSLYGKFASNPREYETFLNLPPEFIHVIGKAESADKGLDLSAHYFSGLLGPWALAAKGLDDRAMRFYNIATASSITGYVRAFLWRTLCETKGPIYCDTDSIAAEGFGEGVEFGPQLGQWKHEGHFDRYALGGRKLYAFRYDAKAMPEMAGEWKTASKGVRLTPEEIQLVALGESVTYENDKPTFSVHHPPRLVNRKVKAVHRKPPAPKKKVAKNT